MFNIFITIFSVVVLCLQSAYAETEHNFRKHLDCFKAIKGEHLYVPDRYASGYFQNPDIVVLPHSSSPQAWLIVTESSIYHHIFETKEESMITFLNSDGKAYTKGDHFELSLTNGKRIFFSFNFKQRGLNGNMQPALALSSSLIKKNRNFVCELPSCTKLMLNHQVTNANIQFIINAIGDRIQTVYRRFSKFNYQKVPPDDSIAALNKCIGIDDNLDSIIEQEKAKF